MSDKMETRGSNFSLKRAFARDPFFVTGLTGGIVGTTVAYVGNGVGSVSLIAFGALIVFGGASWETSGHPERKRVPAFLGTMLGITSMLLVAVTLPRDENIEATQIQPEQNAIVSVETALQPAKITLG